MKKLIMLFVLFTLNLSAAGITGTWKATAKTQNGTIKRTFVFNQDGTKLTSKTTSDRWGTSAIQDGKIDGDTLSFTVMVDIEVTTVKISFKGTVQGDVINMTAEFDGRTLEFTAKRATSVSLVVRPDQIHTKT